MSTYLAYVARPSLLRRYICRCLVATVCTSSHVAARRLGCQLHSHIHPLDGEHGGVAVASSLNRALRGLDNYIQHTKYSAAGTDTHPRHTQDVIRLRSLLQPNLPHSPCLTSPLTSCHKLDPTLSILHLYLYFYRSSARDILSPSHTTSIQEPLPALPPSQWLTKPLPLSWTSMYLSPLVSPTQSSRPSVM